jgi:hypothetical protein
MTWASGVKHSAIRCYITTCTCTNLLAPLVLCTALPPAVPGTFISWCGYYMKQETQVSNDEPVGIVISRGWEPATTPRFSAYMWSHGPEDELEQEAIAA